MSKCSKKILNTFLVRKFLPHNLILSNSDAILTHLDLLESGMKVPIMVTTPESQAKKISTTKDSNILLSQ